jgi:aryl-alcohol dehydrogenase-like predicted oxidoreductase
MSLPENQRKLEAVEQLAQVADDAGLSHDRAGDRVRRQPPGVTSAIIGPRTMEQLDSQLPAADVASTPRSSTASTRSSSPASTSTPPTPATASRPSSRHCAR